MCTVAAHLLTHPLIVSYFFKALRNFSKHIRHTTRVMGWRHALPGGFSRRYVASSALFVATRGARPPRPPVWASRDLFHSSPAVPLEKRQQEVPMPTASPSTFSSASQRCEQRSPRRFTSVHFFPASTDSDSGTRSSPLGGTCSSSPVFSSGVNSRGVGSLAMAPPPQSYAYVNGAAAKATVTHPHVEHASSPPLSSRAAVSAAPPASRIMKVAVDGEDQLVAAAPGAVRRALRQQGHSTDSDTDGSDPDLSLPRSVAQTFAAAFVNSSGEGIDVAGGAASFTPVERHARRLQQRRTREAQARRRQERAQQQSDSTFHPCRLQGGCQHRKTGSPTQASVGDEQVVKASVCPYRHFPSHYCVTQLRDGHCFLHSIGCCPWTHSDLSKGIGRSSPVSVLFTEDAICDLGLRGLVPLVPLESSPAETALRRSARKVGVLLQLFLDAVIVMMEGATAEQAAWFARADVSSVKGLEGEVLPSLKCWWDALAAVSRCSSPPAEIGGAATSDTESARECEWFRLQLEVLSREEDLAPDISAWRMLSMPVEVVCCALSSHSEDEVFLSSSIGDPVIMCASPFTAEECECWASFFTVTAPSREDIAHHAGSAICENGHSALHGGLSGFPSVRLTPCTTAWVLKTAATLMRAKSSQRVAADGREAGAVQAAASATTASACFEEATLFLLGWRRAELQRCLIKEVLEAKSDIEVGGGASGEGSKKMSRTSAGPRRGRKLPVESPLRWSSVLFLRDALLCTYLYVEQLAQAELEQTMLVEDETSERARANRGKSDTCRNTLFDVFVDALCTKGATAASRGIASASSVRDGAFLSENVTCPPDFVFSPNPTPSPSTVAESSPSASVRSFQQAWDEAHVLMIQLQQGLLRGYDVTAPADNVPLCLYTQSAMLHVVSSLSVGFARQYETALRRTIGWRPWTDAQLFLKEHSVVYNADSFSRHHMPVVRLGLHNSLLNTLLLLATHHANTTFRLHESSDVERVLFSSPLSVLATTTSATGATSTTAERQAASWRCIVQQETPAYRQQHLQSSVALSLGFLTALQEHSREQLEVRDGLMRLYEQRRTAYECDHERPQSAHSQSPDPPGVSRVRKYNRASHQSLEDGFAEQRRRLEELRGVSLLDRLLPFGSATVSPDATASLLRQLLEGGHPYKALKLAASIVHASRMLRHADKQPKPSLERGARTVHTRVWSRRLQRYVLVKKHVPVLRLVGDVDVDKSEDRSTRPGARARRSVLPVGLAFVMNDRVVVEMARVGLRMGGAGAALVTGVVQDCQRGALLNFTERRGLPAPVWEDIVEMLSKEGLMQSLSSGVAPTLICPPARASAPQRHRSKGQGSHGRNAERSVADLLAIMGVGGHEGLFYRNDSDVWGAVHQRIAPTPALLEVLETHAPPSNTVQHTLSLKLLLQDVTRFSTMPVLLALQYQACFDRSRFATSRANGLQGATAAMQTAYVMTIASLTTGLLLKSDRTPSSTASAAAAARDTDAALCAYPTPAERTRLLQALRAEAEASLPGVNEAILADASSVRTRHSTPDNLSSLSWAATHVNPHVDEVKALLLGTTQECSVSSAGRGHEDGGGAISKSAVRRQAKLSLAVLHHHLWNSSILARSTGQQATLLWAVCAATLLGLSEASLSRSQGSCDTKKGGLDPDGVYTSLTLHHAYVAAGPLLMHVAPQQSPSYVDATVKSLLLSRLLLCCEDTSGAANLSSVGTLTGAARADTSGASTPRGEDLSDEWPMILSSATAVRVCSLPAFLALQCALCISTYSARECPQGAEAPFISHSPPYMVALLEGLATARVAPPDRVREWPAWGLFSQLLQDLVLAQMWLHDTLLFPSSHLLTWLVGALSHEDMEGYALLRVWLGNLEAGPRLPHGVLEVLRAETERRYRSAVSRRLRKLRR